MSTQIEPSEAAILTTISPSHIKGPSFQRTSSKDARKDFSQQTLFSLLRLLQPIEYFITVDHFKIWRRHLAWAKQNGADLRNHLTQRFASNMVFMSLLLATEINVLFNSCQLTTKMRRDMTNQNLGSFEFWIGIVIIVSAVLTLLTLITTFTAWGMISSISDNNAHCVLRSSIGQYVVHMPSNLVVAAIYSFLLWVVLWLFVMLPGVWPYVLLLFLGTLFFHIVIVFSAFGRLIMHSGAMSTERIFDEEFEEDLNPHGLHNSLLYEATMNLKEEKSVKRQYRATKDSRRSLPQKWKREKLHKETPPNAKNSGKISSQEQMRETPETEITPLTKDARTSFSGNVLPHPSILNAANHRSTSISRIITPAEGRRQQSVSWDNIKSGGDNTEVSENEAFANMRNISDETENTSSSEHEEPKISLERPLYRIGLDVICEPGEMKTSNVFDPETGEMVFGDDLIGEENYFSSSPRNEIEAEEMTPGVISDRKGEINVSETQPLLSSRKEKRKVDYSSGLDIRTHDQAQHQHGQSHNENVEDI